MITNEIDLILDGKNDYSQLRKILIEILKNSQDYDNNLVELCSDIHEADTDTAESEEIAIANNLHKPSWFIEYLSNIKKTQGYLWVMME